MILHLVLFVVMLDSLATSVPPAPTPTPEKDPFIFNPRTLKIYDLKSISSSNHDDLLAIACPAQTEAQLRFQKKNSLDQKALFVRGLVKKDDPYLQTFKCQKPYRMAVAFHKDNTYGKQLEFGYEVYYEGRRYYRGDFIKHYFNAYYGRAEDVNALIRRHYKQLRRDYLKDLAMKFVWISEVHFRNILSKWKLELVWYWYPKDFNVDKLQATCKNNDLGLRVFHLGKKRDLADLYSPLGSVPPLLVDYLIRISLISIPTHRQENQRKIFSQLQLPESADEVCKSQYKCVEEYNLVAPYRFQASISEPIECSHLTSVPIWHHRTKELLEYTEKFIIALSQTVGSIDVLTGLHKELSFPQKNKKKPKLIPVRLNSGKLSAPKIIYKVVSYIVDECDHPFESTCQFDMVIVIHNEPVVNPQEKLCEDGCEKWGWESIQYLSTTDRKEKSQFIYCCHVDLDLKKELLPRSKRIMVDGILSLKNFHNREVRPGTSDQNGSYIKSEVEKKMKELFGPKLDSELGLST